MSARGRLEKLLRGEHGAPAYLPMVEPVAPRLACCTPADMAADAALWASGVQQAGRLLGADAVGIGFNRDLAIQSCRASLDDPDAHGPMTVLLDTAERLFSVQRANLGCIIALTGPATLAAALAPDRSEKERLAAIKAAMTRLMEAACRHRPDLVVFLEDPEAFTQPPSPDLRRAYGTYRKIAAYFGIGCGLQVDGDASGAESLGCDVLFANRVEALPTESWRGIVMPLPQNPDEAKALAERLLAERVPGGPAIGFGVHDINETTNLENLIAIKTAIAAMPA